MIALGTKLLVYLKHAQDLYYFQKMSVVCCIRPYTVSICNNVFPETGKILHKIASKLCSSTKPVTVGQWCILFVLISQQLVQACI